MSHSTHVGLSCPLDGAIKGSASLGAAAQCTLFVGGTESAAFTAAFRGRLFLLNCPGPPSFLASFAVGVGHNPDAVPVVRGAKGCSGNTVPFRVIPERGQITDDDVESAVLQGWDVLHDDVAGS